MGNQQEYIESGGFSKYLYETHNDFEPVTINGIRGKVLHYVADGDIDHTGLPQYANTSDMYFRVGPDGKVIQGKVYIDRRQCIDFDWGHDHTNYRGNGMHFPKGVVHVQTYGVDENGVRYRLSDDARHMNNDEIKKYGPLIHWFCPEARFR